MEKLYCTHCQKTFDVRPEEIRLVVSGGENVIETNQGYRYEAGCFFKRLAALKREACRAIAKR